MNYDTKASYRKLTIGSYGFTLLELLITVSLLSILLIVLYGSFFSIIRGQLLIESALERTTEISRFLDIFSRELRSAFFKETNSGTYFAGEKNDNYGKSISRLTFTTLTYPALKQGRHTGDILSVRYSIEESQDGKMTLYKETWNPYMHDKSKGGFKAEVIEDIEGFELSYFNGKDWAKAWDATLEKRLPHAVKAVVVLKDNGEIKEFTTIARIMIR